MTRGYDKISAPSKSATDQHARQTVDRNRCNNQTILRAYSIVNERAARIGMECLLSTHVRPRSQAPETLKRGKRVDQWYDGRDKGPAIQDSPDGKGSDGDKTSSCRSGDMTCLRRTIFPIREVRSHSIG